MRSYLFREMRSYFYEEFGAIQLQVRRYVKAVVEQGGYEPYRRMG